MAVQSIISKPSEGMKLPRQPFWRDLVATQGVFGATYVARELEHKEALHRIRQLWQVYRLLQVKGREAGLLPRNLGLHCVRREIRRQLGAARRAALQMGIAANRATEVDS